VTESDDPKERLVAAVEERRERLTEAAREIWAEPELAFRETESAALLQELLRAEGFAVETGIAGLETAFVARYGSGEPVVGTMGEFDALPGLSQRAVAERDPVEEGAPGHGCGHNLFGVGSLGGALAVRDAIERGDAEGTVLYYGTPAEEAGGGKVYMVRAGAFDEADAVVSWHPGWYNAPGKGSCLAVDSVEFAFEGETSHAAAAPESGRSALDAAQLLGTGVEYMREHVPDDARIHYVVTSGGDAANVVPGAATVEFSIRSPDRDGVDALTDWVTDIAEAAATMTRTSVTATKTSGYHDLVPNVALGDAVGANMARLGGIEYTDEQAAFARDLRESLPDEPDALSQLPPDHRERAAESATYTEPLPALDEGETGMYSTDSGDVSWTVPLGRFTAATWVVGTPAHSWQAVAAGTDVGVEGALYASKVIGTTLYDLLTDPDLLERARTEWADRTAGTEYESPMPADVDPTGLV
jgi:aminobenzoyl-glutamate utilization protein B